MNTTRSADPALIEELVAANRILYNEGVVDGFTRKYGLKRLVYFERYDDIREAQRREEAIKHWPRAWKVRLIHSLNPDWDDLYDRLL